MSGVKRIFPIPVLLFFLVVAIGVLLIPSIGPAWDEPDNMFAGGVYWNFFAKGFDQKVFTNTSDNASSYFGEQVFPLDRFISHLPPVYNYIGTVFAVAAEHFGAPLAGRTVIIAYHLMTVLFLALLVVMTYEFGILLGLEPLWSVIAAISTCLYPTVFGHGLSNSKDTAQSALFITSLYFLVRSVKRSRPADLIIGAVIWGLGLATKFNAVYVPIIWGIWSMIYSFGKTPRPVIGKKIIQIILSLFIIIGLGILVAIAVWPYLWFDTVNRILEVVRYFTSVGQGYRFFWNGQRYQSGLGISYWWYPLESFVYQTPLPLFFIVLLGIGEILRSFKRYPERLLLVIWIVIPFLRAFWPWASLYDQLRHFIETIPAFLLTAAIFLQSISRGKTRFFAYLFAEIIVIHLLYINVTYFPYAAGYYNILARNPNTGFDRDIESLTIKEAVDYIHTSYGPTTIWAPLGGHLSWYYMTKGDTYVYNAPDAKFIILINKSSHFTEHEFYAGIADSYMYDHMITRNGNIFAWIYKRIY